MLVLVGHVVSILVSLAVIVTVGYMAATIKSSTLPECYSWVPKMVIVLLLFQASIFLVSQADYLLGFHGNLHMDDPQGASRVIYGILNGITLVTFATGLNIFFRWKRKPITRKKDCPLVNSNDRLP